MKLINAEPGDVNAIINLFRETVSLVNSRDYNAAQIEQWLLSGNNTAKWVDRIKNQFFLLAKVNDALSGFCSLTKTGHLDVLFVHKDFQGRGIARCLVSAIEGVAYTSGIRMITADVSITAKPFFLKCGFFVLHEQSVILNGIALTNFKVFRNLSKEPSF